MLLRSAAWALLAALVASCAPAPTGELVSLRDDLLVGIYHAEIHGGLSDPIHIEAPPGTESMLIEVRGERGLYYLAEFTTPSGQELIESARFTTRAAREVPGLVDWLYPNRPEVELEEGTYELVVRARDPRTGDHIARESIELRVYTPATKLQQTCGIRLDFLVDTAAIDLASFEAAVDGIVANLDRLYRQVGIGVIDYQIERVDLRAADIDIDDRAAIAVVDDVLARARRTGGARDESVHVLLVRRIGGASDSTFDPAGYSMGLPGPYDADRPNAAVLVSTEQYADFEGYLDVDGLSSSLGHEIGHYLGLYHTSERGGLDHDPIPDTPECDTDFGCSSDFQRNLMTSSFRVDGPPSMRNRITPGQGAILRRHALCVPMHVDVLPPPLPGECDAVCEAPETCAVLGGVSGCARACDPDADLACPDGGTCVPDELGTYVCKG